MSPDCSNCKFKAELGYTHHITCKALDEVAPELKVTAFALAQVTGKVGSYVSLNPHGVKNGWADWPLEFDPVWVEECKFFQEK